jgi:hypothetical protein
VTTALKGLSRARHQVASVFDIVTVEIFADDRLSFFFLTLNLEGEAIERLFQEQG